MMETLIDVINKLQDICNTASSSLPIDLPQIVVVGTQSSGKSSVIESFVKREFLPRGVGIVTRRPLVIRLIKVDDNKETVKFNHSEKTFFDFNEVREEIERETDRLCGSNKGISPEPITVSVYSKNVVNLTLVDLPGFAKIPVGDQPEDIEVQIRDLVEEYIKNPNSIILAVTAANVDFQTSESIQIARQFDPEGNRTLAVLTKIDMMDSGTDPRHVLTGKLIKIKLGIIGVVNRSHQDIINKKPFEKAIEDEAHFWRTRFPDLASKNGQVYLAKRLNQLLMRHIKKCLPELKTKIDYLLSQYKKQLDTFGEEIANKAVMIISMINKFSLSYCGQKSDLNTNELCHSARIEYILYDKFQQGLTTINPLENLDDTAIRTALRNANPRLEKYVPDTSKLLVSEQIKRMENPSLRIVELVHEEMSGFEKYCNHEVQLMLERFPKFKEKVSEILNNLLNERLPITNEAVTKLLSYVLTLIDVEKPNVRDEDCEAIRRQINYFFDIARTYMMKLVPAAIFNEMVDYVRTNLQSRLTIAIIHKEDLLDDLLSESDDIVKKRLECSKMIESLKQAKNTINWIAHSQK